MATAAATVTNLPNDVLQCVWEHVLTADPGGAPFLYPTWTDRTFVATGTFGGATMTIEGSADGTTWVALKDVNGAAATATANAAIHIQNCPLFMRPNLTVVGAGADIAVTLLARREYSLRT
mgnify:FL=1